MILKMFVFDKFKCYNYVTIKLGREANMAIGREIIFDEKYLAHTITEKEYKVCEILLEDAFYILLEQLHSILEKGEKLKSIFFANIKFIK